MAITILALENDLFFAVKMRDTLRHHNIEVTTARNLTAFERGLANDAATRPALVIVNIASKGVDWEAAIRAAHAQALPVLAFGSHMDLEARTKALKAGAQKVVANSKFARDMPGLVQRMLNDPASVTSSDTTSADEEE